VVDEAARGPSRLRPLRIGITGPIGCGKSTVAGWLAEAGAVVVDADRLAREVTAPGAPALDEVFARFGDEVRSDDGTLDRAALGRIVFADPAALRDLEAIVHPAVRPRIEDAVRAAEESGAEVVAIEAIRLVEAGYAAQCDEVWLIVCDADAQRERLRGRGLPDDVAAQRIAAQGDLGDRLRRAATRVIDTSGLAADVRATVLELFDRARSPNRG
jgi:dephospho-CoA kinase